MRYDSEHKAQTRERIVKEAAALIRSEGPDRMGVAAVMKRVGLTHGGFYAHFASKDDLLAAAISDMFDDRHDAHFLVPESSPQETLGRFVRWYLSRQHVEARDKGCPIPALAGEAHRMSAVAQRSFLEGSGRLVEAVSRLIEQLGVAPTLARMRAHLAVGQMVGVITIARTLSDPSQIDDVLHTARATTQALILGNVDVAPTPCRSTDAPR